MLNYRSNRERWVGCLALIAAMLLLSAPVSAKEGMFLLSDVAKLNQAKLKKRGLKLSPAQLQKLAPAIVQMARGGTGSFVSPKGLMVTNHHVAYSCLARLNATSHKGIMEKGYVANSLAKEVPCPGYDVMVVVKVKSVTEQVRSVVRPTMNPQARYIALLAQKRKLEAVCEKGSGLICQVRAFNGGAGYVLSSYKRLRDVRLVYAPSSALGVYGGDIDNWRYPRHTADFTFLRAYVDAKGKGLPFNKANKPYVSKTFLKVSTAGVKRGSFAMVLGFPGRTSRHATLYAARYQRDRGNTVRAAFLKELLDALPKKGLSARRYMGMRAGLANAVKYYGDLSKQFKRFELIKVKRQQLKALKASLAKEPKRLAKAVALLAQIEVLYKEMYKLDEKASMLGSLQSWTVKSLRVLSDIVKWSKWRKVADIKREGERYRDKNMYRVYRGSKTLERTTTLQGEKILLRKVLALSLKLPAAKRPASAVWAHKWGQTQLAALQAKAKKSKTPLAKVYATVTRGAAVSTDPLQVAVDVLFGQTELYGHGSKKAIDAAIARRQSLFKASAATIRTHKDPLLRFAVRVVDEYEAYKNGALFKFRRVLGPILKPRLVRQVVRPSYWDANFTLRLTYGKVRNYTNTQTKKKHRFVTSLSGLIKKHTGKKPFVAPKALHALHKKKDFGRWMDPELKDVPVNFTATLDTTGGNSGSPTLNGKGELIGLLFDGTPEAILSDWLYLQPQRSICMDIRFALFLAEKLDGASALLKELSLVK